MVEITRQYWLLEESILRNYVWAHQNDFMLGFELSLKAYSNLKEGFTFFVTFWKLPIKYNFTCIIRIVMLLTLNLPYSHFDIWNLRYTRIIYIVDNDMSLSQKNYIVFKILKLSWDLSFYFTLIEIGRMGIKCFQVKSLRNILYDLRQWQYFMITYHKVLRKFVKHSVVFQKKINRRTFNIWSMFDKKIQVFVVILSN